jgi:hypothetical protein
MGSLKPGAAYIYERVGKTVYAREVGADPSTRQAIGWDYDPDNQGFTNWSNKFAHDMIWDDIFKQAENSPALQEALERVKIIYYLSKEKNGT